MSSAKNIVIIGVGSNINPKINIRKAKELLKNQSLVLGESKFVKTKPIGNKNQDDYLNGAILAATSQPRIKFKFTLRKIESQLGRKRRGAQAPARYGPRTIDLDILVWNGKIVGKDFYTRDFIRKSVLELMPGLTKG